MEDFNTKDAFEASNDQFEGLQESTADGSDGSGMSNSFKLSTLGASVSDLGRFCRSRSNSALRSKTRSTNPELLHSLEDIRNLSECYRSQEMTPPTCYNHTSWLP
jgi:hypothetical protein